MTSGAAERVRSGLRRLAGLAAVTPLTTTWHLTKTSLILVRARLGHLITRLQQRRWKSDDTVWTRTSGRSFLATPVASFRSVETAALTLTGVVELLQASGITHRVVAVPPELSRVVVDDLGQAIMSMGRSRDIWYADREGRTSPVRDVGAHIDETPTTVFRAWATHDGRFVAGSDVGVELLTDQNAPQVPAPTFPIDAVVTWVDGSDPRWQQRKRAREQGRTEVLHATADNAARYESLDEIRYALRSIEMYAPWIRHIFLVTDQQVPEWLDVHNGRVTVVDHRKIFDDPTALPTFNSHAIEARLHHIPGLAEHYIYFNDDVFLARALPPSFFFEPDGRMRVFLAADEIDAGSVAVSEAPVVKAAKNNRVLLRELSGFELRHKLKHVPHPQLKSLARELESRAEEHFRATAASPFRSAHDLSIASSLLPHYALATGRGVSGTILHFYADVASTEVRWRLALLREMRGVDAVCLNATSTMPDAKHLGMWTFCEGFLPVGTTPWEKRGT